MKLVSRQEYEAATAATRDKRMEWWREARFGMFIHYGLYSILGRMEWVQMKEGIPVDEYAKLADQFAPKEGAAEEWVRTAKEAGMKYCVLTTRHHEGFSLWDSKVNPFNSVNLGPHRDIVREFVDACRKYDMRIGFYSSLMDWHHPDGWKCAYDPEARRRFTKYLDDLNTELLTNYGKIDILWYDVSCPMESFEGWDSLARNQHLRELQPDIIINNRSMLPEDFDTPEEKVMASDRDWESCLTFNRVAFGYVDSDQVRSYTHDTPWLLDRLQHCTQECGNLLLNIGPTPDGSVPKENVRQLKELGEWLKLNGEAVYGKMTRKTKINPGPTEAKLNFDGNGVTRGTGKGNKVYLWNVVWPKDGTMGFPGYPKAPKRVYFLQDGKDIDFTYDNYRIVLKNLPKEIPDKIAGVTVIVLEFDEAPENYWGALYPQLNGGYDVTGRN
ncbi:MAG: alpha-L-fucosidase [Lachnospiraceae bacterium]|nr:alpha-L-fucosidase [Lachnospiraceae bacterium]